MSEDTEGPLRPDLALSAPVVDLLTTRGLQLPDSVRLGTARLVHEHLEAASADGLVPDTGLDLANALPDMLLAWAGEAEYGDVLGLVIGSLALLGRHLADRHDEFLAGHARVMDQLASAAGQQAVEALRASGLMMKALDLRDGRADLAEAAPLWRDTAAIAENPTRAPSTSIRHETSSPRLPQPSS